MSWSHEQETRRAEIRSMSAGELVHTMIANFDGDQSGAGSFTQNFDYFWAADTLDQKFNQKAKESSDGGEDLSRDAG